MGASCSIMAPVTALDQLTGLLDSLDPNLRSDGWTLAQALSHCAQSVEYSLSGSPRLRSGLFRATIGPLVKRKFLRAGRMSHDLTAPVAGAPDLPASLDFEQSRSRLRTALATFDNHSGAMAPHLAYGRCTKDEYATLHLL